MVDTVATNSNRGGDGVGGRDLRGGAEPVPADPGSRTPHARLGNDLAAIGGALGVDEKTVRRALGS